MRMLLIDGLAVILALGLLETPALLHKANYRAIIGPDLPDRFSRSVPGLLYLHWPYWHSAGAFRGGNVAEAFDIPAADRSSTRWDVSYDRNGFRNETDLDRADIAVLGDSFIEELTSATPEMMTSVLQRLEGGVVANLSQFGYGPLHESAALRRYALPLKPKLVVWAFYEGNDLGDVMQYEKVTAALNEATLNEGAARPGRPAPQPAFLRAAWDRSFTANVIHKLRPVKTRPKWPGELIEGIVQMPGGKTSNQYFGYEADSLSPEQIDALDKSVRAFAEGYRLCRSQGARLLVVFIPDKFRVFQPFCRFPERSRCRAWTLSDLPARMAQSLQATAPGLEFLDLTPALTDGVKNGIVPYYPDDSHWNPDGARIGAEAIHRFLHERATLRP